MVCAVQAQMRDNRQSKSFSFIQAHSLEPFEAEGCIVIGAYDGSADEAQNPHYHDESDTPSLIDWNYLTSVTKMVLATVLKTAKGNP